MLPLGIGDHRINLLLKVLLGYMRISTVGEVRRTFKISSIHPFHHHPQNVQVEKARVELDNVRALQMLQQPDLEQRSQKYEQLRRRNGTNGLGILCFETMPEQDRSNPCDRTSQDVGFKRLVLPFLVMRTHT